MIDKWKIVKLSDVATIYDGPHATPQKNETGPIFLGISNLINGRIELTFTEHISEADYIKWTRRVTPKKDDIVFSYETRLGEAAIIHDGLRCCLGRRMGLLRPKKEHVEPRFLLYAYLGPEFQATISSHTIPGSTVDRISLLEMPNFPIKIPDLETQKEIASLLGALDDKISLNVQVNKKLEQVAQGIFKSWFIDFEPVRMKAEGKQPFGMDERTAALFPSEFEDSELGEIPKGWSICSIYDLAIYINGDAFKPEDLGNEGLPVIKIAELKNGITGSTKRYSGNLDRSIIIDDKEILFSWSGNPETSIDVFCWSRGKGILNQHIFKVVPKDAQTRSFIYFLLKSKKSRFASIASNKQTTGLGHVTVRDLKEEKVVMPPKEFLSLFDGVFSPFLELIYTNNVQSNLLDQIINSLLPKLLSGEIRVLPREAD